MKQKPQHPENKTAVQQKAMAVARALYEQNREEIPSDVTGSYTGQARDGSRPQQDADDL